MRNMVIREAVDSEESGHYRIEESKYLSNDQLDWLDQI